MSDPTDTGTSTPGPVFDFDKLSMALKDTSHSDRDKIEAEIKLKNYFLVSKIERTSPNLKALDQYEAMLEKERSVTEEFEAVWKDEKEKYNRFNSVREKRKIYKQLTKSNIHPLGGTTYLNLENKDDPFLHGIKYTAMPPTKRFCDIEQLSGGKRLLLHLHCCFPFIGGSKVPVDHSLFKNLSSENEKLKRKVEVSFGCRITSNIAKDCSAKVMDAQSEISVNKKVSQELATRLKYRVLCVPVNATNPNYGWLSRKPRSHTLSRGRVGGINSYPIIPRQLI
ncbi:hypothetical protein PIB30_072245 [Stylosanthes scabra]|uniref:Uncharacterized protein n=1 Tax=Stylosanthes scabra TaxID=79078 RepID=A0ABU6WNW9_9FABA|nr:hypothetical protein [Stylosanthes scabra]